MGLALQSRQCRCTCQWPERWELTMGLSVYDAADIWLSSGKDEDQMFGYTREQLEAAADED